MQNRIGPNRAGPCGILQTLADGIKLFFKEDLHPRPGRPLRVPARAVPRRSCPRSSCSPSSRSAATSPTATTASSRSSATTRYLQLADPPIGILFVLAMSSIAVYGVMLAGWSSGSKYPLLGSVRASAQMVSLRGGARPRRSPRSCSSAGTLSTNGIVAAQDAAPRTGTSSPPASCRSSIFLIAATAEINRPPFDLVEAEQELVGGFNTEYTVDPLRALLPRRVHERDHDVGDHRHAVPRRPAGRRSARHPGHPRRHRGHRLVLRSSCSCSCSCTCGSGPRCPACATTS